MASPLALAAAGGLPLAALDGLGPAPSRRRQSSWWGLLTEVCLRGLPTRDDRLQEDRVLILDERHRIHAVLASDHEDALAAVTLGVRVLQDIGQVASLDVEDELFEPDAALRPELRVLRVVPVGGSPTSPTVSVAQCVLDKAHIGVGSSVPASVPKPGPRTINR